MRALLQLLPMLLISCTPTTNKKEQMISHDRIAQIIANNPTTNPRRFSKIGDSHTYQQGFMWGLHWSHYTDLGDYSSELNDTWNYFWENAPGYKSSFNRLTLAASGGWKTTNIRHHENSNDFLPLVEEIAAWNPRYALIMLGTNDCYDADLDFFDDNLDAIAAWLEERGVVPILSTIPPRVGSWVFYVRAYNYAIRNVAQRRNLPLIDLYDALIGLSDMGLGPDNIHLTGNALEEGSIFTVDGLQKGMPWRTLLSLQMLDEVRR